ncbi:MAG: VCBS repeat-containing protein, partial [Actinomycetota bacterium]|nr:VCBS repeat-containing protein [Actinomycetota bacterium]
PYVGPNWKIRGVGDVNGDGKADIIWQHNTEGWLAVWLMDGLTATSTLMLSVPKMTDPNWIIAGAGDINGDGKADIIWQNQATGGLAAWLMNGPQAFAQTGLSVAFNPDLNWKIRGVGDVNGDGRADLIWQNIATGQVGVWFLNWFTVVGQTNLYFTSGVATVPDMNWKIVGPG